MLASLVRWACATQAFLVWVLLGPEAARGQIALTVDPERSLVWWQIEPHFGHLWGTTCPNEPSWQAGEGRSPGFYVNAKNRPSMTKTSKVEEYVPLYPRMTVRPLCRKAVRGTLITAESVTYSGLKGYVVVTADSIATGADVRDEFSRKHVFKSMTFSTIRFEVDSLSGIAQNADTLGAVVHGAFEFRGVQQKIAVPIQVVDHTAGHRVRGKFSMRLRLCGTRTASPR
jgi:hypothetical protein